MMRERVANDIAVRGWHITGVSPTDDGPMLTTFAYTAGLWHTYRHAELAVFGLHDDVAGAVLSRLVDDHIAKGEAYSDGQRITGVLNEGYPLFFRSMPNHAPHWSLSASASFYDNWDFPALQVVLPDVNGLFPWEPGVEDIMVTTQDVIMRSIEAPL